MAEELHPSLTPKVGARAAGAFAGRPVIGGASPDGVIPPAHGSGIFGYANETEGIFDSHQWPGNAEGVFFNPYASDMYEHVRPETKWAMMRRPGQPLFPGASTKGIVLLGPSMGTFDLGSSPFTKLVIAGLGVAALAWYLKRR